MRKTALAIILSLCLLISLTGICLAQPTDISGHWSENQVLSWINKGLISGYPDGSFKPDNYITRAEFITLVNRAFNFNDESNPKFSDINSRNWYAGEVAKSVAAGYISGYQDGTFRPNKEINRLEASSIIARVICSNLSGSASALNEFLDQARIPAWGRDAAGAVAAQGIIKGYADQTFRPLQPITRSEAVVALDRALAYSTRVTETIVNKAGTYGPAGGEQIIEGNLTISTGGVTLQNTTITGNLLLAEGIGEGEVVLKNVKVVKSTTIKGGGSNSIDTENCTLPDVIVDKPGVNVTAKGGTLTNVTLESGATLCEIGSSGLGFENVKISQNAPSQTEFSISGTLKGLTVAAKQAKVSISGGDVANLDVTENASGTELNIAKDVTVQLLNISAAATITGKGKIETARVMAAGSTIELTPDKLENPNNVDVTIGRAPSTSSESNSHGSGGGDGNNPLNFVGAYLVDSGNSIRNNDDVPVRPAIQLVFDRGVVRDYWDNNKECITMESASGNEVPLDISRISNNDDEKRHIYATPISNLDHGKSYNLIISPNLKANNGNTLGHEVVVTFRVKTSGSGGVSGGGGNDTPAAPTLNFAQVTTQGDLSLTFSKDMADPAGKHAGFSVTADSVTEAVYAAETTADTKKIKLVLADKVTSGDQVVQVAYTKPDDTALQVTAVDGGVLQSFDPQDVTNGLAAPAPLLINAEVTTKGDISLQFDKEMSVPAPDALLMEQVCAQFTVTVDGAENAVTSVNSTNTPGKIKLVLVTKVTTGQNVMLAYTPSDNSEVQLKSAGGGVLASFTGYNVTNNLSN